MSDLSAIPAANCGIVILRKADTSSYDGIVVPDHFGSCTGISMYVEFERRAGKGLINFPYYAELEALDDYKIIDEVGNYQSCARV